MEVNIIKEKECKETDFEEISINQEQSPSTIVNETNEEKYIYMNFKSLLSGTVYTIQVISSNIIRTEIQPLYNKMSIDPQIQYLKLIFGGKLLEQDKTFDFYNLKDNHTIIVLVNNLEISNNNSSSNNSNTTRNNRNNNSNNSDSNIEVNEIELDVNPHSNENINNGINGNEDSNIDPVYIIRKNFFILILGILIGFAFADHSVLILIMWMCMKSNIRLNLGIFIGFCLRLLFITSIQYSYKGEIILPFYSFYKEKEYK